MALNAAALTLLAITLESNLAFAQLHSGLAGTSGIDNIAVAARQSVPWGTIDVNAGFGLASSIDFTGGTPFGTVYSVSLWDTATGGNFYGEFPLGGDGAFNGTGQYSVTVIDFTSTATD